MTNDIELTEVPESAPTELLVQKPKAGGYLAFYTCDGDYWMQACPMCPVGTWADTRRFPYPLFQTKDEAIEQAKKSLPNGGKIKLWKIEL